MDQVQRQLEQWAGDGQRSGGEVGCGASQGEIHSFNCGVDEVVCSLARSEDTPGYPEIGDETDQ